VALAMKVRAGQLPEPARQLHAIVGQVHAIAGQVHAPAGQVGWFSYGGSARVVLAVVLVAVAAGVTGVGLRLRVPVRLPSPGRTARTVMLAAWGTAVVAFLAFFAFALMLLIFAVWALFGLGYPSAPLPFAFNAASKVVAFVVALSLFLPQRGQASTPEPTAAGDSR
jgi:hypothetical protein